jgi:hypothetical protein
MGLMPGRAVAVVLPVAVVLGLLGARAGAVLGAVPPTPTVTLPTVTVPPLPAVTVPSLPPAPVPVPVPVPPPPPMAVPPKVQQPPLPSTPAPPVEAPVQVPPIESSAVPPPAPRGGAASSRYYARKLAAERARKRQAAKVREATVRARPVVASARAPQVKGVSASVQGPAPEDGGFLGPLSAALGSLDDPAKAIPGGLFAMAALAVFLLSLASMPMPLRTSRAGATLVHKRGSIAAAGIAALGMAIATYFLL